MSPAEILHKGNICFPSPLVWRLLKGLFTNLFFLWRWVTLGVLLLVQCCSWACCCLCRKKLQLHPTESGFEKPAPDSYWSRKARQSPVPSEVSTSIRASPSSPQARARKSSLHPPVDPELGNSPKVRKYSY
jgi:hypothetical protein